MTALAHATVYFTVVLVFVLVGLRLYWVARERNARSAAGRARRAEQVAAERAGVRRAPRAGEVWHLRPDVLAGLSAFHTFPRTAKVAHVVDGDVVFTNGEPGANERRYSLDLGRFVGLYEPWANLQQGYSR